MFFKMPSCLLAGSILSQLLSTQAYAEEPPFIVDEEFQSIDETEKFKLEHPDSATTEQIDKSPSYTIKHVSFRGGSVFELSEISKLVNPLIGKAVKPGDLRSVLNSINIKYRDAGYPLSYAYLPKQDLSSGRLEIYLIEGYIGRSEILIEDQDIQHRVHTLIEKIKNQRPLKTATFDRAIALIESTPGYRFRISAPKPKTISGATTIRIEEVKSKKFESNLGLENNSQDDTRILATANIQSLTSNADRLSLSTLVPNNTVNSYYAITYRQDLNSNGLQLEAAANHYNNTDINKIYSGSSPLTISEEKNRNRFRLGINYPFLLFRSSSWWGGASLQHLNEDSHFVISSDSTSTTEVDKLLRYSAVEINSNWLKKTGEQTYQVHGRIKQGLELGNEKNESTRSGTTTQGTESLNFTLINLDALWKVRLSPKWQVQTKTNIFWSDDQLPSAESVRYGGRHFGRGYPGAQAQGDKGYAAEIELRYLIPSDSVIIKRIEPYLVLDTAHSESNAMGIQHQLSSVALGLDLTDIQYYRVGFEYAQPTGDPTQNSNDHEPTYNLNLRWQF